MINGQKIKEVFLAILVICVIFIGFNILKGTEANAATLTTVPAGYKAIYSAKDLNAVREKLNGKYILMNDIDLKAVGSWEPIGGGYGETGFSGIFDGNGYSILNMTITDKSAYKGPHMYQYAGLFSMIDGATVKNINLITGKITSKTNPCLKAGAVSGLSYDSNVSNCVSKVNIVYEYGYPDGSGYTTASCIGFDAGGIIGTTYNTKINQCGNFGQIKGTGNGVPMRIGGITGRFSDNTNLTNCFNNADHSANTSFVSSELGGIAGGQFANSGIIIRNCYSKGKLFCTVGVNEKKPELSVAYVGGIVGKIIDAKHEDFRTKITNCYYDANVSSAVGMSLKYTSVNAKACDITDLTSEATYAGFDFGSVWKIDHGISETPIFSWVKDISISSGEKKETIKECSKHKFTSKKGDVCSICGYKYSPTLQSYNKILFVKKGGASVRTKYYLKCGSAKKKLKEGVAVVVTHKLKNSIGEIWYKNKDGYFILGKNLTSTKPANKCVLTFNANGGEGVPDSIVVTKNKKQTIPNKLIPHRDGYIFLGYGTKKKDIYAKYTPGEKILISKDTVLYAVWKTEGSLSNLPQKTQELLNNSPGVGQESDTCTSAATTVILQRRQIVDGLECTFTYKNVREAVNYNFNLGAKFESQGKTYTLKAEKKKELPSSEDELGEHIALMLRQHPEGIVIYFNYGSNGNHAIVLSDYEIINGKYQFYSYDSANTKLVRCKLEETAAYKNMLKLNEENSYMDVFKALNDGRKYFKGGECIWYIE